MHGHEAYANKRHKGNHYDHEQHQGGEDGGGGGGSLCQPQTPRSVSTFKSELDNSPAAPLSSPEEGNNGHSSHPASFHSTANGLPLSDSNISTTNHGAGGGGGGGGDGILVSGTAAQPHPAPPPPPPSAAISTFCTLDEPEDINVSCFLLSVKSQSLLVASS